MSNQCRWHHSGSFLALVLIGGLVAGPAEVRAARAVDGNKSDSSLKWIPADAAFYSAMLRNGEQLDAVLKSRAWAKFKSVPFVQEAWQKIKDEWSEDGKLKDLYKFYQKPENRELVALLGDMTSQEVFVYGSESWAGFAELGQTVYGSMFMGPLWLRVKGQAGDRTQQQLQAISILQALNQNRKLIRIPDLVIGFKVSKKERAKNQLHRLGKLLNDLAEKDPQLKERIKREKLAGNTFLTLRLDGKMIPWDKVPIADFENEAGEYDKLITRLKNLTLTLSVGLREDFVLVSLGETNAHLTNLGKGKLLVERPEFKPLTKFADKRIASISYVSQKIASQMAMKEKDVQGLGDMVKGLLEKLDVTDKQRAQMQKDIEELAKDLKPYFPKPGAKMAFTYLNGRGYEGYSYDWGKYPEADASKPLTLLNHAGGSPLLVAVAREKSQPAQYQLLVKWVKVANRYFEEFAVPKMDEDTREKYQKFAKGFHPLMKKADEVTRNLMIPALADGQVSFVLDSKLTSKQWIDKLPATDKPLPIVEPALVVGVSDADKLRKGFAEYRKIGNDILALIHSLDTDKIPELKIPRPKKSKGEKGDLYSYPLPEKWGLDKRIVPSAGISDKVLSLAISKEHAERLLADTPLKVKTGPLAKADKPLSAATYFNFARTIDTIHPWVEMATRTIAPKAMRLDPDDPATAGVVGGILDQIRTVFEVLKVCHRYSSSTYLEDGVWVTHHETVIRDLPQKKVE
jgi:hypothetical protein